MNKDEEVVTPPTTQAPLHQPPKHHHLNQHHRGHRSLEGNVEQVKFGVHRPLRL